MDDDKKDVIAGDSSTTTDPDKGESNPNDGKENDKDKNFAELRKKLVDLEKENAELRKPKEDSDRTLSIEPDKKEKSDKVDPLKAVFDRDLKEATIQWNQGKKVSAEEWAEVKKKVSLSGDETISEIKQKIDEAYESLPDVRQRREKELIEKGKREAMQQFQDDELDIGGGGDPDLGGGNAPRFTAKEDKWLKGLGVTPEERKQINKDAETNEWSEGKAPVRKFFQP